MDADAFEQHAAHIAAALNTLADPVGPGWTATPNALFSDHVILAHPDGRTLVVYHMKYAGRLSVSGDYPATDRPFRKGEKPEITAALDRPALTVARRILSPQFMGVYRETLATVRAHNAKKDRHTDERRRITAALRALLPDATGRSVDITHRHKAVRDENGILDTDGVTTDVQFSGLTEHEAEVLVKVYAALRAPAVQDTGL